MRLGTRSPPTVILAALVLGSGCGPAGGASARTSRAAAVDEASSPEPSAGGHAEEAETPTGEPGREPPLESPPTRGDVRRGLRVRAISGISFAGRIHPVGDGTYVTVVTSPGSDPSDYLRCHFVVMETREGRWVPRAVIDLDAEGLPSQFFVGYQMPEMAPRVAAHEIGDLDADGEPEVMVFLRFHGGPEPGTGPTHFGHYFIIDLVPQPTVALSITTQALEGSRWGRRGHARRTDADGDGHPDVEVRASQCAPTDAVSPADVARGHIVRSTSTASDLVCTREPTEDRTWFWDEATDRWQPRSDSGSD